MRVPAFWESKHTVDDANDDDGEWSGFVEGGEGG